MFFGALTKKGMEIKAVQTPKTNQITRQRTAVIVKQDKHLNANNKFANKFYSDLAEYLRAKKYAVSFSASESGTPPPADLWITYGGHNTPKDTKQLVLPQYARPFFTKQIRDAVDRVTK